MAKATALDKVRRVRQRPKPKSQSAQIGPDGPKHPGNRQLYDKRGCPDASARLYADYPNPKVATFCTALWLTFTLPLNADDTREEAADILRGLIEKIAVRPDAAAPSGHAIELHGELGAILTLCGAGDGTNAKARRNAAGFRQVTMVAGTGFEPVTFRL